jgi:hypothetical protein
MPRFSEAFGITIGPEDDWFDPVLERDTTLFVDPFLVADDSSPFWGDAYTDLIEFFNVALALIADSGGQRVSRQWRMAKSLLMFPEPFEFALGYGKETIFGAGTGDELGRMIMNAANDAIQAGISRIESLEELILLGESIGPDRISDLVCNVMKSSFIEYTQGVASRHELPIFDLPVAHVDWDTGERRWIDGYRALPRNPVHPRAAVLLTPRRFLRELPTIDAEDFWEWAWLGFADDLKKRFNYQVASKVNRREIVRLARFRDRQLWVEYVHTRRRRPYDFEADPRNIVVPYDAPKQLAAYIRLQHEVSPEDFCDFVRTLIEDFAWTVEDKTGWKWLWTAETPRSERVCQDLFEQTLVLSCKKADVDMTREGQTGRGPVDFKFSTGWERRAHVEMKLAGSGTLHVNTRFQVPQYLRSEDVKCGFLVVVQFFNRDFEEDRVAWVIAECARISSEERVKYEPLFVDARRDKPSASKIRQ